MIWYRSKRQNDFSNLMKQWLLQVALLVCIPVIIKLLFPKHDLLNHSYWYLLLPFLSLTHFIQLCLPDRVNEIIIDMDFKEVSFKYYDIYDGQVFKTYPFDALRLEIIKSKKSWLFQTIEINFMIGKREVMSLSRSKDGFSVQDLNNLATTLDALTSLVMSNQDR
jgi:hypothetical protein